MERGLMIDQIAIQTARSLCLALAKTATELPQGELINWKWAYMEAANTIKDLCNEIEAMTTEVSLSIKGVSPETIDMLRIFIEMIVAKSKGGN